MSRRRPKGPRERRPAPCTCPACAGRCTSPLNREAARDCRAAKARRLGRRDRPR
ncbi:MAG TPA: hypothetical protein VFR97_05050 [Capillimicrobium sp.]|nr:hypothetical protein [Capillimicrobium sp.]